MALENQLDNIALTKYYVRRNHLKPHHRFILVAIFSHRNNCNFLCFPSIDTIAEDTGYNRKTILRAVTELEESGDLIRVKRWHGNRVLRTYYFSPVDFMEAKRIAGESESVFFKAGDDELLEDAEKLFKEAMKKNVPF